MEEINKSKKSTIIIIILLIIVIIGLVGYIAYDKGIIFSNKNNVKENESQNQEKNINTETKIENIDLSEAQKLFEDNIIPLKEEHLYPTDIFDIKDISTPELINLIFKMDKINYCIYEETQLAEYVTIDEINQFIDAYIPNHHQLTIEELKENGSPSSLTMADYEYDDSYGIKIIDNKIYLVGPCHSMTDPFEGVVNSKITLATKEDKELYIYLNAAFGEVDFSKTPEDSTTYYFNYYNNYNKEGNPIETISVSNSELSDFTKHNIDFNKYNTYKYTFTENNGKYILNKIELDK